MLLTVALALLAASPIDLSCLAEPPKVPPLRGAAGVAFIGALQTPPGWDQIRALADGRVRLADPDTVAAARRELLPFVRWQGPTPDPYWEIAARALLHLPADARTRAALEPLKARQASECALASVVDVDTDPSWAPFVRGLLGGWRWRCALNAAKDLPRDPALGERLLSLRSADPPPSFVPWARAVLRHVDDSNLAEAAISDAAGTLGMNATCLAPPPSSSRPAATAFDIDAAALHGLIVDEVERGVELRGTGWSTTTAASPFHVLGPLTLPARWLGDDVPTEGWALDVVYLDVPVSSREERRRAFLPFIPSCDATSGGPWVRTPTSADFDFLLAVVVDDLRGDSPRGGNALQQMPSLSPAQHRRLRSAVIGALDGRTAQSKLPGDLHGDLTPLLTRSLPVDEEVRLLRALAHVPGGHCALAGALGPRFVGRHPTLEPWLREHLRTTEGLVCALAALPALPPDAALAARLQALSTSSAAFSAGLLVEALRHHAGDAVAAASAARLWSEGASTSLTCDGLLSTTSTLLVPVAVASLANTPRAAQPLTAAFLALALAGTEAAAPALAGEIPKRPVGTHHVIGALGRLDRGAMSVLLPLVDDDRHNDDVRRSALLALGFLGPEAEEAAQHVAALSGHGDLATRRGVAAALMAFQAPLAESALLNLARDEDPGVREFAACGLAILPRRTAATTRALARLRADPVDPVRFCAGLAPARRRAR
jgi:hypothetical protein